MLNSNIFLKQLTGFPNFNDIFLIGFLGIYPFVVINFVKRFDDKPIFERSFLFLALIIFTFSIFFGFFYDRENPFSCLPFSIYHKDSYLGFFNLSNILLIFIELLILYFILKLQNTNPFYGPKFIKFSIKFTLLFVFYYTLTFLISFCFESIDNFFKLKNQYLLDFICISKNTSDNLKGNYFCVINSILVFFGLSLFRNKEYKKSSIYYTRQSISFLILSIGIYLTLFVVINFFLSFYFANWSIQKWISNSKNINLIPLRIVCFLLFFRIINLIYPLKKLFVFANNNLTYRIKNQDDFSFSFGTHHLRNVAQVGFYIVILFSFWITIEKNAENIFYNLGSFLLLYIVDDWTIISQYRQRFNQILTEHSWKIRMTNILLTTLCILNLIYIKAFFDLIICVFFLITIIFNLSNLVNDENNNVD